MGWVFSGEAVTQESLGRSPISVNLRGRDQDRGWWLEKSVPQGPHESSPVSGSCRTGLAFLKEVSVPDGTIDRLLAIAERRARSKAERFLSSLAGRTCLFASFPSTSYWATFTESLRDKSSTYNPKLLKLTLMGRSPRNSTPKKSIALKARFNPGRRNAMSFTSYHALSALERYLF
jgi:hypothetical protein